MKYSLVALAATSIFGGASARSHLHNRRHGHPEFKHPNGTDTTCIPQCTTYVTSYLVDYTPPAPHVPNTLVVVPVPEHTTTVDHSVTSYTTTMVTKTHEPEPTPEITTCPTPGTYTIPEKTITLTNTEYICVPTTTQLPPGEHTYGGITTVVETQTTITCPVPTVETSGDVTTTKVTQTTYVCPTPGTYTINPITTTLTETVDCEYPVVTEYPPGTYTAPEVTTTITKTNEVVTCPLYTTTKTMEVVPIAPTEVPEKPSYEPEITEEVPEKEVEEVEEEVDTPVKEFVPKGDLWAITYSPYSDDGQCKAGSDVDRDIKDIASKGFKSIRLYSSDCNGLETVGGACSKYGLKIVIGVFIKAGGPSTADSQVKDIITWNRWDLVEMFVVGNEAIFQGFCTAEELAAYIIKVTGQIRGAGYEGPVTTTEPLNIYQENDNYKPLCSCMDVVGINIHPYFNPEVTPENAGTFLSGQLKIVEDLCGKTGYVLEAGWPSSGQANGKAVPSIENQAIAIKSIETAEPGRVVIFTYRNDLWKQPGAFGVEQNFGCAQLF